MADHLYTWLQSLETWMKFVVCAKAAAIPLMDKITMDSRRCTLPVKWDRKKLHMYFFNTMLTSMLATTLVKTRWTLLNVPETRYSTFFVFLSFYFTLRFSILNFHCFKICICRIYQKKFEKFYFYFEITRCSL